MCYSVSYRVGALYWVEGHIPDGNGVNIIITGGGGGGGGGGLYWVGTWVESVYYPARYVS